MSSRSMAGVLSAALWAVAGPGWTGVCANVLPPTAPEVSLSRTVQPRDLAELRDIGPALIDNPTALMFALSPDGRRIAFQMHQANVDANTYCYSLVVKPLDGMQNATVLDTGGEFIKRTFSSDGYATGVPGGIDLETQPLWSPDGSQIAYLRRDSGVTQVWLVNALGGQGRPLTSGAENVDAFAWGTKGDLLVFTTRPGLNSQAASQDAEGRGGFLYDDRWVPGAYNRPLTREPIETVYKTIEIASGAIRDATAVERQQIETAPDVRRPANALAFAVNGAGDLAWTAPIEATVVRPKTALTIKRGANVHECRETWCSGIIALWWEGDTLVFLRNNGVPDGGMSIYRWGMTKAPVRVLTTRSYLTGCQLRDTYLYCREESALQPGRLVRIDAATGRLDPIYDPNPEFAALKLGAVQRLHWTNAVGIETWGDLVLPPDRAPNTRLPLIIVQYTSNGFLRGGTGDEFPIQVLAAHGFAVLSVQRPLYLGIKNGAKTWDEVNRIDMADWGDRKSVLSAFETIINQLADQGVIDRDRVGITGLSDGASSAQFAILNSQMFKVAALSQCCEEESSPSMLAGSVFGSWFHGMGYPKLTEDGRAFWAPMSLRANAARLNTPILMQISDIEYLGALEGYVALKEQKKPVELYVFPDDNHVKWQPAHRFAAYTRYVEWFDFWLNGVQDANPAKAEQYRRWQQMTVSH